MEHVGREGKNTYHLPAVFHELWDHLVQQLRGDTHEPARLWIVGVRLVELRRTIETGNGDRSADDPSIMPQRIILTAAPPDRRAPGRSMVQSSAKGGRGRRLAICEDLDAADAEAVVSSEDDLLKRASPVCSGLVEILHTVNTNL